MFLNTCYNYVTNTPFLSHYLTHRYMSRNAYAAFAITSYFYLMFVLFFQIIIINFVAE